MRFEKGSKRCAFVVAVSLVVFFALLGALDDVPGEEALMVIFIIVFDSNMLAS